MAKIVSQGEGTLCRCTGAMGHGYNGCKAVVAVLPSDLIKVHSLATLEENLAFVCPQCGTTSDYETREGKPINRVKKRGKTYVDC